MLRPFSRYCVMIGAIPESIIHSLSYEQQLLRLIKFLKTTVIPAIDGNTTAIKAIEEWIENVDLQEFVDTKLDAMAESGELEEIISVYLNSKAIFGFDTISDMISAENLIEGSYAKTSGYHSMKDNGAGLYRIRNITNEDVIDNGSLIAMENEQLVAELIDLKINVKQFGAYGDDEHDDTESFKKAIDYINKVNLTTIYIPIGTYIINDTLILKSDNKLIGEDKYKSVIKQKIDSCLDKPIISSDTTNNSQLSHIKLENIKVLSNGNRTVYPIIIYNASYTEIINCFIKGNTDTTNNGVFITKSTGFNGDNFVTKVQNCLFSQATLKLDSGDSLIDNNLLWGDYQLCAIYLMLGSSNTIISNNEIVGGSTYGAIYFDDIGQKSCYQILDNYFDGSYADINTKYGIYSESTIIDSVISNNKFWKQKSGGIKLRNAQGCIISNNNFIENDYYNNGDEDISIGDYTIVSSFGNVISSNTFKRYKCYNEDHSALIDRPTSNQPAVIKLNHAGGGYAPDSVTGNNLYYDQYYSSLSRNNTPLKSTNNNHKYFSYSNIEYGLTGNYFGFRELQFNNQTNSNLLNLQLYSKNPTRGDFNIANNTVYIVTSFYSTSNHFDMNNNIENSFRMLINNPNVVDNLPTGATTKSSILENYYITTGYRFQRLTTNSNIYTRLQDNGTWSEWIEK